MNINEVSKIQELISRAELESAKAQGQIEAIKQEWKKVYGTDDINEMNAKLKELEEEYNKTNERLEVIYNKLLNSYDWNALEKELSL